MFNIKYKKFLKAKRTSSYYAFTIAPMI